MLFVSYPFLFLFLPLALVGYRLAISVCGSGGGRIWLCLASLVFYAWWNPVFVLLLTASIAFNYTLSRFLIGERNGGRHQGFILFLGVAANVALLFYFKYFYPLLQFLHDAGWIRAEPGSVLLPIGISFFTFTQIGYLVDCRDGAVSDRHFINYVLFVTFFPHLIAGPILHHREIMPQFASEQTYRLRAQDFAVGMTAFGVGMAKKVLLADTIAPWVDACFSQPQHLSVAQAWSGALGYSMQLYFDFSGYSDMAVGLGALFGIRLPINFNSPYRSLSIIEFWQRWHMTLTRYVTLLIYNPLALWVARRRRRKGLPALRIATVTLGSFVSSIAFPTVVTVLIAGIWHGAGLPFILFGALHGVYLCINHAWRIFHRPLVAPESLSARSMYSVGWRWLLTYVAALLAQVAFRSANLSDVLQMVEAMVGMHAGATPLPLSWPSHFAFILASMLVAFCGPNAYQFLGKASPALTAVKPLRWPQLTWRPDWRLAAALGLLMAASTLLVDRSVEFLYFRF